jgi:hypothetical protein
VALTDDHKALLRDTATRLHLSASDVVSELLARYAAQLRLAPRRRGRPSHPLHVELDT